MFIWIEKVWRKVTKNKVNFEEMFMWKLGLARRSFMQTWANHALRGKYNISLVSNWCSYNHVYWCTGRLEDKLCGNFWETQSFLGTKEAMSHKGDVRKKEEKDEGISIISFKMGMIFFSWFAEWRSELPKSRWVSIHQEGSKSNKTKRMKR